MACAVQAQKQDRRHNARYAIVLTHTECASIKPTIAAPSRNLPRKSRDDKTQADRQAASTTTDSNDT